MNFNLVSQANTWRVLPLKDLTTIQCVSVGKENLPEMVGTGDDNEKPLFQAFSAREDTFGCNFSP